MYIISTFVKNVQKNFSDFCKSTLLPGFRYIGDTSISIVERLYFLSSVLVILIYVITLTTNIYEKWESTPVLVSYSPTPILINKIPFPAVTICNVNQALASKVRNFSRSSVEYSMLQTLCNRPVGNVDPQDLADIDNTTRFHQFIEEVAQPCGRLFLSCKFAKMEKHCEDIFQPILTDEGHCCSFNLVHSSFLHKIPRQMDRFIHHDGAQAVNWDPETGYEEDLPEIFFPRLGTGTGISAGLTVIMNAESDDYYCTSTNGLGFKLLLHNAVEIPSLRENGLYVQVGAEVTFRITADRSEADQNIRNFKIKERQCVFKSERQLAFYKTYTRRNCEMECQANMTAMYCDCISFFLPKTQANMSTCSLKQQKCQQEIHQWTPDTSAKTGVQSCIDICAQGCFDLSYTPDRFAIPLTDGGYMIKDELLEKFNSTYLKKNIAVVHFYYKLSHFSGFMRTRYIGTTEFISNSGGLIGLLGFSLISVSEIFYFIVLRPLRPVVTRIWNVVSGQRKTITPTCNMNSKSRKYNNDTPKFAKARRKKFLNKVSYRY